VTGYIPAVMTPQFHRALPDQIDSFQITQVSGGKPMAHVPEVVLIAVGTCIVAPVQSSLPER